MTTQFETAPETPKTTDGDALAKLKKRYPKVRVPILVAAHILTQNPDISEEDAKAQAALHEVRITAASIKAAERLLANSAPTNGKPSTPAPKAAKPKPPRTRERRPRQGAVDVETVIRAAIEKVQAQGDAEAERLREAIRRAVAVLEAAVGEGAA